MTKPDGQAPDRSRTGDLAPDDKVGDAAMGSSTSPRADAAAQRREKRTILGLPMLALLGAVALLVVVVWLAFGPGTIRPGMTRAEVDSRLGPPNGRMLAVGGKPLEEVVFVWKDRGLVIEFDEDERVREVKPAPSWWRNLLGILGF